MKNFFLVFFWTLMCNASEPFVSISSSCDEEGQKVFKKEFKNLDPRSDCYTFCIINKSGAGTNSENQKCFPTSYETAYQHKAKVFAVIQNVFKSDFEDIFDFAGKSGTTLESLVTYLDKYKHQACNKGYNKLEQAKDRFNALNKGLQCEREQSKTRASGTASQ